MDVGGGIAVDVLSRDVSAWILAFARMTKRGAGRCARRGTSPRATFTAVVAPGFSIDVLPRGYGAWGAAPLSSPSGFQPRIGVRGVLLIAGKTSLGVGVTSREAILDRSPGHAFVPVLVYLGVVWEKAPAAGSGYAGCHWSIRQVG